MRKILYGLAAVAIALFAFLFVEWTINRVYVPEGSSLMLRYKGPLIFGSRKTCKPGHWAEEGEIGILEKLRGPGRHFYCPVWWEREIVPDVVIQPGSVGMVTCKLGDPLPDGEFLVDGEIGFTKSKGVLRKVLGPGRYRINPYGYEVKVVASVQTENSKHSGWVKVPTGYVGVVTNLTDNPITHQSSGIQDRVLPPGIYPINPKEQQVDIVEIGFRETSIRVTAEDNRKDGDEPDAATIEGGISFPSSDGFKITMDFTAIWGLMPDQAPDAIRKFGNVDLVEQKIILPQIESICRNNGSEYSAVQLLVGKEREEFQRNTLREFERVLASKKISLRYGLVRHIYIPREVRQPIQTAFIADELKLTREQEQTTAKMEGELREAERKVELEAARIQADTERLKNERLAEGSKTVGEIRADTRKLTASIDRETAELKAKSRLVLGTAENDGKRLVAEAKAGKFKLAVEAFGTPDAYNRWMFAQSLPDNIDLNMLYAGPGTMWTDLRDALRIMTTPSQSPPPQK